MTNFFSENYISRIEISNFPNYNSYISGIPAIKYLYENDGLDLSSKVTFFVGENGSGKSTLLEAMAVSYGFNAEGGSKNFTFSTNQTHSDLHKYIRVSKGINKAKDGYFLRAESFYNVASNIDYMDSLPSLDEPVIEGYGGVSLHEQSHGESFFALIMNRFRGNGLYILDEPEAALSPSRQMSLLVRINQLVNDGSQFIIATHSPILTAFPNSEIYQLHDGIIEKTSYEDTENYQITKSFLENPNKMINYLFEE